MLRCSRFIPALLIAFVYALIVPLSILARMGRAGWPWVWNETAFGFFMVVVFPFAVAVFCCVVRLDLLKRAVMRFSNLSMPVILFAIMLIFLCIGVKADFYGPGRTRQPYVLRDATSMQELAALHDQIFRDKNFGTGWKIYNDRILNLPLSSKMSLLMETCNFINVGVGIAIFCYILLLGINPEPINEKICNHLVFVLAAFAVWFPCRAYAEWYINLSDTSWIRTYQAAWVILGLLFVGCIILALKMTPGSLYHRFVIPGGAVTAALGTIAAVHPRWLSAVAVTFASFQPMFKTCFALIVVTLLYYISNSIHQRQ